MGDGRVQQLRTFNGVEHWFVERRQFVLIRSIRRRRRRGDISFDHLHGM